MEIALSTLFDLSVAAGFSITAIGYNTTLTPSYYAPFPFAQHLSPQYTCATDTGCVLPGGALYNCSWSRRRSLPNERLRICHAIIYCTVSTSPYIVPPAVRASTNMFTIIYTSTRPDIASLMMVWSELTHPCHRSHLNLVSAIWVVMPFRFALPDRSPCSIEIFLLLCTWCIPCLSVPTRNGWKITPCSPLSCCWTNHDLEHPCRSPKLS